MKQMTRSNLAVCFSPIIFNLNYEKSSSSSSSNNKKKKVKYTSYYAPKKESFGTSSTASASASGQRLSAGRIQPDPASNSSNTSFSLVKLLESNPILPTSSASLNVPSSSPASPTPQSAAAASGHLTEAAAATTTTTATPASNSSRLDVDSDCEGDAIRTRRSINPADSSDSSDDEASPSSSSAAATKRATLAAALLFSESSGKEQSMDSVDYMNKVVQLCVTDMIKYALDLFTVRVRQIKQLRENLIYSQLYTSCRRCRARTSRNCDCRWPRTAPSRAHSTPSTTWRGAASVSRRPTTCSPTTSTPSRRTTTGTSWTSTTTTCPSTTSKSSAFTLRRKRRNSTSNSSNCNRCRWATCSPTSAPTSPSLTRPRSTRARARSRPHYLPFITHSISIIISINPWGSRRRRRPRAVPWLTLLLCSRASRPASTCSTWALSNNKCLHPRRSRRRAPHRCRWRRRRPSRPCRRPQRPTTARSSSSSSSSSSRRARRQRAASTWPSCACGSAARSSRGKTSPSTRYSSAYETNGESIQPHCVKENERNNKTNCFDKKTKDICGTRTSRRARWWSSWTSGPSCIGTRSRWCRHIRRATSSSCVTRASSPRTRPSTAISWPCSPARPCRPPPSGTPSTRCWATSAPTRSSPSTWSRSSSPPTRPPPSRSLTLSNSTTSRLYLNTHSCFHYY